MAKTYKTDYSCLCGSSQQVLYPKPQPFQGSSIGVTCKDCGTEYYLKFKKDFKFGAGKVGIESRIVTLSDSLRKMIEENEREQKVKHKKDDSFRFNKELGVLSGEQQET